MQLVHWNIRNYCICTPRVGLFVKDWLWMEKHAFINRTQPNPRVGNTCIWWNEV